MEKSRVSIGLFRAMKIYYSGFNGFGQVLRRNSDDRATIVHREDNIKPEIFLECNQSEKLSLYIGWSRMILTTGKI